MMATRIHRGTLRATRTAFTIIEVMIVIVLVLAIGGLVAYNLLGKKEEAQTGIVKIQMQQIGKALKDFRFTHDRWPTEEEGLKVLWEKDSMQDETGQKKWSKLLEKPLPTDPWGNDWGFRPVSEHGDETTYDLWSIGPDKQEGTADDIVTWEKEETGDTGTTGSGSGSSGSGT